MVSALLSGHFADQDVLRDRIRDAGFTDVACRVADNPTVPFEILWMLLVGTLMWIVSCRYVWFCSIAGGFGGLLFGEQHDQLICSCHP